MSGMESTMASAGLAMAYLDPFAAITAAPWMAVGHAQVAGRHAAQAALAGQTTGSSRPSTASSSLDEGDAMWRALAPGESSEAVQFTGRVRAPAGLHLRSRPAGPKDGPVLPFDTLVAVRRKTEKGWFYIVSLGGAIVGPTPLGGGFVEGYHLATDPPEPTAHLHPVQPGDMLKDIAARYYGQNFAKGNDARLYVQAIYHANQDRDAVFRQTADLTVDRRALETDDLSEAQALWNQARVVAGQALWIPGESFVQQLKSGGAIHHASISKAAWDTASQAVDTLAEGGKYAGGFVLGLLEGAWGALFDLCKGMVDLIQALWPIARALSGDVGTIMAFARKLGALWNNRDDILLAIASDFLDRWQADDSWDRGNFQGEVLGYVLMSAFIMLITVGAGAAIIATGRFGSVMKLIRLVDSACDITTYVGPMVHAANLPGRLLDRLADALGHGTPRKPGVTGNTPDAPGGHRVAPDSPYQDPRIDPDVPHRRLEDHELASAGELGTTSTWSDALAVLQSRSTAIGKTLKSASEGHQILAHLARGDASALRKLGIDDFPPGADPSKREWALVQTRDGYKVYVGQYDDVEFPANVRPLAHTHPTPAPDTNSSSAADLAIPGDSKGLTYDEILSNRTNARKSGITPSLLDIHAISGGTSHVIYTRYVHLGKGRIGNPTTGATHPRVALHLTGAKVIRSNPRTNEFWYKVDVAVRDSSGKLLETRTMYGKWISQFKRGDVQFHKPPELQRPAPGGWKDHE